MNGPGHYQKAEELAEHAEGLIVGGDMDNLAPVFAALAQVHDMLANAAAAALSTRRNEEKPWVDVAGTKLSGGS